MNARPWTPLVALALGCLFAAPADAAVVTKKITYAVDGKEFVGHLAYDDAAKEERPGVLVVHEWWGLNDYARGRAEQLAGLGYVAFACDMYGGGKSTTHPNEAKEMATAVRQNVAQWQKRAAAALDVLKAQEQVDDDRLAAIGYCFGGSTALQLAYAGADLDAVVTFHGALPTPTAEQAKAVKATILVCHGAQDSFIPEESVQKFRTALDEAGADWQLVYYAGTKHSFTDPKADEHNIDGMKYDKHADERSWRAMQDLFDEKFAK